jgi:hypothetical protein
MESLCKKEFIILAICVVSNVFSNCSFAESESQFDPNRVIRKAFLVDTSVVYIPAPWHQRDPSIAFDGTNYFVVWQDRARNRGSDIFGARVDQSGRVLDSAGIIISAATNWQLGPAVAFDGTNYFVVWQDLRNDSTRWNGPDIYGARVSQTGVVLDTAGIAICIAADRQWCPSIAFDGTNYLIVWEDRRKGSHDIYGTRVSKSGEVLNPTGFIISNAANNQKSPSLSFDGKNYLVVWQDNRSGSFDIYGTRVNKLGVVLDKQGFAFSTSEREEQFPSVTFNGESYYIVWGVPIPTRTNSYSSLHGVGVSKSGKVLDTRTYIHKITGRPKITFDGERYLITWNGTNAVFLDTDGTLLEVFTVYRPSGTIAVTDVLFDGTNYVFVWEDRRHAFSPYKYSDIYGARMSRSGNVLDTAGFVISTAVGEQLNPSVAFDGTNYLVVWKEHRGSSFDIYGIRISQYGAILDTASIAISTAVNNQYSPVVSFDGENYFVVWYDWREGWENVDIYGTRVNKFGIVLDTAGIAICTDEGWQTQPSIVFDGVNYFIVWRNGTSYSDIYGTRVSPRGKILDPAYIAISTADGKQTVPVVAFDGKNYLVVWQDQRIKSLPSDIYGARVNQSGTVLDPDGFAIWTTTATQKTPVVAFTGENYFVFWDEEQDGTSCIFGARINQFGLVIDSTNKLISDNSNFQQSPAAITDGRNCVVLWQERQKDSREYIRGARLDSSGAVIDVFTLNHDPGDQVSPALALGYANQIFIAYTSRTDSINGLCVHNERIWGRLHLFK